MNVSDDIEEEVKRHLRDETRYSDDEDEDDDHDDDSAFDHLGSGSGSGSGGTTGDNGGDNGGGKDSYDWDDDIRMVESRGKVTKYDSHFTDIENDDDSNCKATNKQGQSWIREGRRADVYAPASLTDYGSSKFFATSVTIKNSPYHKQFLGFMKMVAKTKRFKYSKGSQLCQGKSNVKLHRKKTKTNWCGEFSNREHTPCPDSFKKGKWTYADDIEITKSKYKKTIAKYDWYADGACRRHDHGIRFDYMKGGVRLGCNIDYDLSQKTLQNGTIQSIFGKKHSFASLSSWGCYHRGEHTQWDHSSGVWKRVTTVDEMIYLGSKRYDNLQANYHYGYTIPFRYCHSDKENPFLPNYPPPANYWWENNFGTNFQNYPLLDNYHWDAQQGYYKK